MYLLDVTHVDQRWRGPARRIAHRAGAVRAAGAEVAAWGARREEDVGTVGGRVITHYGKGLGGLVW